MPTYFNGSMMSDEKAAEIIRNAFPKWPHKRRNKHAMYISVHTFCDALLHARVKCKSEATEKCIEWAYGVK